MYLLMKEEIKNGIRVHSVDSAYLSYDMAVVMKNKKDSSFHWFIDSVEVNEMEVQVSREDENICLSDDDEVLLIAEVECDLVGYPVSHNPFTDKIREEEEYEVSDIRINTKSVFGLGFSDDLIKDIKHEADNYAEYLNNQN